MRPPVIARTRHPDAIRSDRRQHRAVASPRFPVRLQTVPTTQRQEQLAPPRIRKRVPEYLVLLVSAQLRQARADLLGRAPRRLTLAVELRTRVQRLQPAQPLHQRSFERQHRRDPSTSAARRQPAPAAPRSRPQVFDASIADAGRGGVTFELLILDDIGYVQQSAEEVEVLFTLMAERYERRSLLITSNLTFSEWDRIFKNPMTTAAAIDRLVHHSSILEFGGRSKRADVAEQRGKPAPGEARP